MMIAADTKEVSAGEDMRSGRNPIYISTVKKPVRTTIGARNTNVRNVRPIKLHPRKKPGKPYAARARKSEQSDFGPFAEV